jgi:hypothetical protein
LHQTAATVKSVARPLVSCWSFGYRILTTSPRPIEPIAAIAAGANSAKSRRTVGWSTENHQGNLPPAQVLLIRNVLVHGNQNIKAGFFGSLQGAPVFQARKIGETGGFALVAREQKPQSLVNAFVDQNPHDARASKSFLASASASKSRARETVGKPCKKSSKVSPPSR